MVVLVGAVEEVVEPAIVVVGVVVVGGVVVVVVVGAVVVVGGTVVVVVVGVGPGRQTVTAATAVFDGAELGLAAVAVLIVVGVAVVVGAVVVGAVVVGAVVAGVSPVAAEADPPSKTAMQSAPITVTVVRRETPPVARRDR